MNGSSAAAHGASEVRAMAETLRRCVEEVASGPEKFSILFSGGLDSSLVAWLLADRAPELICVGVPGSTDLERAGSAARFLGVTVRLVSVDPETVLRAASEWAGALESDRSTPRSVHVAFGLALRGATSRAVLCGQGADELFFGYAHSRELPESEAEARAESDLRALTDAGWPTAQRLAASIGKEVRTPFLHRDVVSVARSARRGWIPLRHGTSKPLLRAVARSLGLPDELANRPKKAMQYGSGVERVLRSAAVH